MKFFVLLFLKRLTFDTQLHQHNTKKSFTKQTLVTHNEICSDRKTKKNRRTQLIWFVRLVLCVFQLRK